MRSITLKPGDCFTVGEDTAVQLEQVRNGLVRLRVDAYDEVTVTQGPETEVDASELGKELRELAGEVVSQLAQLEPSRSKELLSDFVSELFLSAANQNRRAERRQKQAEGIAAAKARGVKFGRQRSPLPDSFERIRQEWRGGQLTLREAADACGMAHSSFYDAAIRQEKSGRYAVR